MYENHKAVKDIIDNILEKLSNYIFKFEYDFIAALRYEKMGLPSSKNTSYLSTKHKASVFYPNNGFKKYIDYIQHKINLIKSFYDLSQEKGYV